MGERVISLAIVTPPSRLVEENFQTDSQSPPTNAHQEATTATSSEMSQKRVPNEINGENVADLQRAEKAKNIKSKFGDILNVNDESDCGSIEVNIEDYSDDRNVNGSLSEPQCIEFFKILGANDYIIDTLTHGHHSTFTQDIPRYERNNNKSYFENESFAIGQILELIGKKIEKCFSIF